MNRLFACFVLSLALIGCGKKEEAPNPQVVVAQQNAAEAERQRVAAVAEAERQRAAATEAVKQKDVAEDAKSNSQMVSIGLAFFALIALFVGIGMGSSSRKDAAKQRKGSDD